ncbi:pentatricopeptide repeat-containing protein At5g50390, chloroplastic [Aristolochia californica]|uniref:pentatricopeptide repeat-containing protein At5g50390, chloroplastic n=1 Tax=Aristolochia californica TaxID=171875 RepID=UPI0035E12749
MEKTIFACVEYLPADHIQSFFMANLHIVSPQKTGFSPCFGFSSKRRKSVYRVKSSALESGLHPKPRHKSNQLVDGICSRTDSPNTHSVRLTTSLSSQIEKLVYFKRFEEALELLEILEDYGSEYLFGDTTYEAIIDACIALKSIRGAKKVCNHIKETGFVPDQYLRNRVLAMHVKCGMMVDARRLFAEMPEKNVISWNTIIGGLVDSGNYEEALGLFLLMWKEYSDVGTHTFAIIIRASVGLGLVYIGRQIHSCVVRMGLDSNIFVSCALIDMYSKCGILKDAKQVFYQMPEKTVVGWNSIIAGYALHGYGEDALDLYYEMQSSGVKMDHFTFSVIISICAKLASLEHAKQAHAGLVRHGFGTDIVANTALVDFYSKWGRVEDARSVFDKMLHKNIISWNALIAGYGNHGQGEEAIKVFKKMLQEGMVPNHVTFLAVLSACSYSGLADEGWDIFESMSRDHRVKPRAMHYACMIELLGREGYLDEALALIKEAPFEPTKNMWSALLTACRIHKNLELGKFAAERLLGMEPQKLSNYMVLLNIYNSSSRPDEAVKVVKALKQRGLRMLPACSWIEINKRAHQFSFGETSHPLREGIYRTLNELMKDIQKYGYVPDKTRSLLPDVEEPEEQMATYHSEKLAIAFGLISTPASTSLQVVQNHRLCGDCHNVIKLIALVTKREIVVRDASRFHHFKQGTCSCGDYW